MITIELPLTEIKMFGSTQKEKEAGVNKKMTEAGIPVGLDWKMRGAGRLKVFTDFEKDVLVIKWDDVTTYEIVEGAEV